MVKGYPFNTFGILSNENFSYSFMRTRCIIFSPFLMAQEELISTMKSYLFEVIIEPDEDVFDAYVPVLEERGASTWGYTKEEALKHIQEVTKMVIESMIEDREKIPQVRRTPMESQLVPSRFSGVICSQTTERSGFAKQNC